MSNDEFHFRDFSMRQAPSGQRVNTDSCVFGALIGRDIKPTRALDIGCGTGVLTLMLAARHPDVMMTAVEPELEIADVAQQNFTSTPWAGRIKLLTLKAQELDPEIHGRFDFVFCNPPYFQNSMISDDRLRMVARHNTSLSPDELYDSMIRVMTDDGSAWVSFPGDAAKLWMERGGARKNKNKISTFRTSCRLTYRDLMSFYPSRPSNLRKNIPLDGSFPPKF